MWRYLRLYAYFVRFSVSRAMEFRMDFFFRIVMDLIYYGVNLAFFKLVFLQTPVLAGWNESQAMIFVGCYLVVDAIVMTVFSNNSWMLPLLVNRGDLDYYLVRPASTFFFAALRDFAANSFVNLLFALGILGWALAAYPVAIPLERYLTLAVLLPLGAWLYYFVQLLFILPVFWTHSERGWVQVFWGMSHVMERPDRIFTGWVRKVFTTVLPFGVMASFPARIFLEARNLVTIAQFLGVVATFALIVAAVWRAALRNYASASS